MNPSIAIENANGDLLDVQLDANRVRESFHSPLWLRFLLEEFVGQKAISNVGTIDVLPLGPELACLWLETEGNEFESPPLEWQFEQRLADALQYPGHPLIRIEADADRVLVRRCLNDWFGDANGPMVTKIERVSSTMRVDMDSVDMTLL